MDDFDCALSIWNAARELVGTRFRLHGRNPATGLDCVGLVAAALNATGVRRDAVPTGYGLSDHDSDAVVAMLLAAGLRCDNAAARIGHIALYHVGQRQHHLAIIAWIRLCMPMPGYAGWSKALCRLMAR